MLLITLFLTFLANVLATTQQNIDSSSKSLQKEDFAAPSLEDIVKQSLCTGLNSKPELCQDMEKKFSSLSTKEFFNLYKALPQKPRRRINNIREEKIASKLSILHNNFVLLDEAIKSPLINKEEKEKKLEYYKGVLEKRQKDFYNLNENEKESKEKLQKYLTTVKRRIEDLLRTPQESGEDIRELQQKITTLREEIKKNKKGLERHIPKILAFPKDLKWIDHKLNENSTGYQVAFIGMSSPMSYRTPFDSSSKEYHNVVKKIESLNEEEEDVLDGQAPWQRKTPFLVCYQKLLISEKKSSQIFFLVAFVPKGQTSSIIEVDEKMKKKANRMLLTY